MSPSSRVIMHVDMDYFFVQCETRRDPSLKGRPVLVCVYSGRGGNSGTISTASYEARSYGAKSGIPISQAKRKLKGVDAIYLPVDKPYYLSISGRIMAKLEDFADKLEVAGIDEAYLDITERTEGDFTFGQGLARRLKERVLVEEGMTCSVGLAPNKLVAKISTDFSKPDGLTMVRPEQVKDFLSPLPVDRLLGVGSKRMQALQQMQVKTIGDLAGIDVSTLRTRFGRKLGQYYHSAALGIDDEPVRPRGEAEQISRIATLPMNTASIEMIGPTLESLSKDLYSKLIEKGLGCRSIGIIAIDTRLETRTRSRSFDLPTADSGALLGVSTALLEQLLAEPSVGELRRVGIRVSDLTQLKGQARLTDFLPQA